jgi:hypothetical protein
MQNAHSPGDVVYVIPYQTCANNYIIHNNNNERTVFNERDFTYNLKLHKILNYLIRINRHY